MIEAIRMHGNEKIKKFPIVDTAVNFVETLIPLNLKAIPNTRQIFHINWQKQNAGILYLAHLTCPDCIYTPPCNHFKLTLNSLKCSDVFDTTTSIGCEQPSPSGTDLQYKIGGWMAFMKGTNWYPGLVQKVARNDLQIKVLFRTGTILYLGLHRDLKLSRILSTAESCVKKFNIEKNNIEKKF